MVLNVRVFGCECLSDFFYANVDNVYMHINCSMLEIAIKMGADANWQGSGGARLQF